MRWTAVSLAIAFVCVTANQAVAQKKVALVIGNNEYANEPPLQNPERDARHIGAALRKLGFELVGNRAHKDLNKATTDRMLGAFETMAKDADIALFYFSGHGRQVDGTNYLLPIDVGSYTRATVSLQTLNADLVVTAMEDSRARLKIILLDACRTPVKGPGGGLVSMQAPEGTVIGFATQPNHTAQQGPMGGVSPYAEALAYFMGVKGLEIFAMLNEVGLRVMKETRNDQRPWVSYSAIQGPAYLNPPDVILAIPATPPELQGYGRDPPASPPTELRTSASLDFIQLAWKQLDKDEYAAARATLTKGIEADRNSAVAYSYRGFAWYLEGSTKNPRDAYEAYRKGFPDLDMAIQLDPSYAPVRRHRGNTIVATYKALRALGRPTNDILDRAIDDLKDAVRLDPTSEANSRALKEAELLKRSSDLKPAPRSYQPAIKNFNKDWPPQW
jgi:Caspase domain